MDRAVTRPRSPARAAFGMGAVTVVSRAFGFVRVLVVAAVLGTTYLGNAFQASNSVSNVMFELLAAGALSAVLVPTFVDLLDRGDDAEAERLAGALLGVALAGLGLISVVGILGAPAIARLLTSGVGDARVAAEQRELATFLLRFFVPQVMLYAYGAVATALLYARRRFAITAGAPIGNTLVMVALLVAFRSLAGPEPGFDLGTGEKLLLAAAGTLGVAAFVGVLVVAARHAGFTLRPTIPGRDPALRNLLRLSAWGVVLQAQVGLLLAAALVVGNSVEGGVVAYQVAFVFFLAPYAVLAQPIHTAILPDLAGEASRGDLTAFAGSMRWALDSIAVLVIPVSAAFVALALPGMRVVTFGGATGHGVELIAAGVASLGAGLYGYGAFLLLARGYYALGDSRTPALVAVATGIAGVVAMVVLARATHGTARVAALGAGHSAAYTIGAVALAAGLSRRTSHAIVPRKLLPVAMLAASLAAAAWAATRAIDPSGRVETAAVLAVVGLLGGGVYSIVVRASGGTGTRMKAPGAEVGLP